MNPPSIRIAYLCPQKILTQQLITGTNALADFSQWLTEAGYDSIYVLADSNTSGQCFSLLEDYLQTLPLQGVLAIPPGEENKTLYCCEDVWEELIRNGAGRGSLLINLGGGVISDLGGFIAATFKRGMDFVNIPTTLLAMTDAAIGGKTGINFRGIKNQLGTFSMPVKIIIDPAFLDTLDNRQFRSGYAEMLKHALVADPQLWYKLKKCKPTDKAKVREFLGESANIKHPTVETDFRETSSRKKLNFGHTIGHALESYSQAHDENPLFHGEAIALGMRVESYLSRQYSTLEAIDHEDIDQYLIRHFPGYHLPETAYEPLMEYMAADKKNTGEGLNFTLLNGLGAAETDFTLTPENVRAGLETTLYKTS